jgi:hypothetical protein
MTFIHVHQRPVFDLPARDDNKTRVIPTAYEPRPEEAVSNPYDPREARTCILTSDFWLLNSGFWLLASGFWLLNSSSIHSRSLTAISFSAGHFVFGRPFWFSSGLLALLERIQ